MHRTRMLMLLVAAAFATNAFAADTAAQKKDTPVTPPANLQPPPTPDSDAFAARPAPSSVGLRPPSTSNKAGIDLGYGINYSSETKSLLMSIDQKQEWGIGLNLNVNSARPVELAPSGIGLQPKRTPGLTLQKKF